MPVLKPNPGEKENKFIARCMGNPTMQQEYRDLAQRSAICYSAWRESKKKK